MAQNTLFDSLTPQQVIQRELATSVERGIQMGQTAPERVAGAAGGALGGLFRQALVKRGLMDKSPDQVQAEKFTAVTEAIQKDTVDRKIAPGTAEWYDMAGRRLIDAGMLKEAVQVGQLKTAFLMKQADLAKKTEEIKGTAAKTEETGLKSEVLRQELAAFPAMTQARFEQVKSATALNKARTTATQALAALKANDPSKVRIQKGLDIIDKFEKRVAANPGKIVDFTPDEKKILGTLKGLGPFDMFLQSALGGGGGLEAPIAQGGGDASAPSRRKIVLEE